MTATSPALACSGLLLLLVLVATSGLNFRCRHYQQSFTDSNDTVSLPTMSDLKTFISDNVVRILGSSDSATVDYVQSLGEYEAQISMFS